MDKVRIGAGAGYAGDRWEPALELVERGDIDFLAFECLAERTIAREPPQQLRALLRPLERRQLDSHVVCF